VVLLVVAAAGAPSDFVVDSFTGSDFVSPLVLVEVSVAAVFAAELPERLSVL